MLIKELKIKDDQLNKSHMIIMEKENNIQKSPKKYFKIINEIKEKYE